jgi:F-box and WD-40 domain protein CDC4
VGVLGLSRSYLVSAAADGTLRTWNPDSGTLRNTLIAHAGAVTSFQHDEAKVVSGSDGSLILWNVRDGTLVKYLMEGTADVWQVAFDGRWCAAASHHRNGLTMLDIWDFSNDKDWVEDQSGKSAGKQY